MLSPSLSFLLAAALLAPAAATALPPDTAAARLGPREDYPLPFQVFGGLECGGDPVIADADDRTTHKGKRCFDYHDVGSLKIRNAGGCDILLWPGKGCQGKEKYASELMTDQDATVTYYTSDWTGCLSQLFASVQLVCPGHVNSHGWVDN